MTGSKWIMALCGGWLLVTSARQAPAQVLRLALHSPPAAASWPSAEWLPDQKNLPLIVVDLQWPLAEETSPAVFPPAAVPVLLRLQIADPSRPASDQDLDRLDGLLRGRTNISHLALSPIGSPEQIAQLVFLIKKISAQARGAIADLQIAIELDDRLDDSARIELARSLAADADVAPYIDAFLCRGDCENVRRMVFDQAPRFVFWQWLDAPGERAEARETLARIVANEQFEKIGTALLLVPAADAGALFTPFSRFSAYLENEMFRTPEKIAVEETAGTSTELPLFQRKKDQSQFVFVGTSGDKAMKLSLEKGEYQQARIENLISGERSILAVRRHAKALLLKRQDAFLAIELVPRAESTLETRANVEVKGHYKLRAEEIVARVRSWDAVQKNKLRSYSAIMTLSMRLKIANLEETFDLTIRGPIFARRGQSDDWAWKEFFVNGVKWKGKTAPKIPLLQPEKVNMLPLAIDLSEGYQYSLAGETTYKGRRAYMLDFKPKAKFDTAAGYRGRIYIDAATFARLYANVIQLNLQGDVLSNIETQYIEPLPGTENIWLPLTIAGQQVFSTGGRVTNVERKVTLTDLVVNPPDLEVRRHDALQSDMQMVRDTEKGMRYLVKDKKEGQRIVEWEVKKSQLAAVLGTFYDTSLSFPLPILGFTYINFNLGGKGRQVNLLFGGALLTANYTDPAFLGSRIDFGADVFAIALPSTNKVYAGGQVLTEEKVKVLPARLQVNFGFPLNPYLKFTSSFFAKYYRYSPATDASADFVLPKSGMTFGSYMRLNLDYKGYALMALGTYARRSRWDFWGLPGNDDFQPDQRSFWRLQLQASKDYFFSHFRRLHLGAGYCDGLRLDRFSALEFGFFGDIKLHGFPTGSVRAERAMTFNVSYGYGIGEAFRLEGYYDSALVTDRRSGYAGTYFSGAGISGTTNIPGINSIVRFDAGVPLVGHGIKGFAVYLVLLKMF